MIKVTIDGKEYAFVFNGNTAELYAQVFGEDIIALAFLEEEKKTFFVKNQRGRKLAFITAYQAEPGETWKTLSRKLNKDMYMEWITKFPAGVFLVGEAAQAIQQEFGKALLVDASAKNPATQQ